ncbi:indolethylamine N-methyltransferase-like [Ixodes scapularis]
MASQALRDAYKERFLPRQYLDELVFGKYSSSQIERLHNFFQSDLIQGETLLDVGSGPVVFSSLIASSKFKHIVLSDLVEGNRLELNKWINDEEGAIDWSHAAEQIAAVEGKSDIKKGALEIIERTRSAIRKVVPCDVLEPGVLPMEHRETFDVVISNGCLDAAAADHESFRRVICNVAPLVKPGGLLVIIGAGGIKSYPVGTFNFPHANLTEDVLKEAVTDAGFQIERYRPKQLPSLVGNSEVFIFILAARKT